MIEFDKTTEVANWLGAGSINFFGLPFAGKDSQAKRLANRLNGVVLGGGDILRGSTIPQHVKELIDQGILAPTKDFVEIVLPYLKKEEFTGRPLFLSSVGRWTGEEEGVIEALEQSDHVLKAVIYLPLDEDIARQRLYLEENKLARGYREDDDAHKLEVRINEFNDKTIPVIEFYRDLGVLIEVDASLPKEEVERSILESLAQRALNATSRASTSL